MNILFSASEMVPFCKTGGLADVIGALPPVLAEMGHDVCVILPGYAAIDRERFGFEHVSGNIDVPVGDTAMGFFLTSAVWRGVTVYLIENYTCYGREGLYGDLDGDYPDNDVRFILYARGVFETALALGIRPDVIHCHDWQAGLVPAYLATVYRNRPLFANARSFFTVHNLGYQGLFPLDTFALTGLPSEALDWRMAEYWGKLSFLKAGLVYAGALSTVSETYAEEITREPLGFGMHGVFEGRRGSLHGIVNGIDQDLWDPAVDTTIPAQYSPGDMDGKWACRRMLLDACGFTAGNDVPVFGMVTRLDDQKGLDILEDAAGRLAAMNIRIAVVGTGTQKHHDAMNALMERYAGRFRVFLRFDNEIARLVYAGSDAFLMPSRYEPCGLGQIIAMRYGTLPVVHATGGLKDTVRDLDRHPYGDGFVFDEYSADALVEAVGRAAAAFREKGGQRWREAVRRVMSRDFSWNASAAKYVALYNRLEKR